MTKKFRYILIFLILACLTGFAVWKYTFKKSESNVASRKTEVTIDASGLFCRPLKQMKILQISIISTRSCWFPVL